MIFFLSVLTSVDGNDKLSLGCIFHTECDLVLEALALRSRSKTAPWPVVQLIGGMLSQAPIPCQVHASQGTYITGVWLWAGAGCGGGCRAGVEPAPRDVTFMFSGPSRSGPVCGPELWGHTPPFRCTRCLGSKFPHHLTCRPVSRM